MAAEFDPAATAVTPAQHDDLHGTQAAAPAAAVAAVAAPISAPVYVAPAAPVAAPAPVTAAVAVPAPAPAPVARIEPYTLPTDALHALAGGVGLEWVNSDAEKIRAVQAAMAAEPAPIRVPREPKRHVLVDEGPLVLVETRKDLSQLKLPFEAGAQPR